MLEKGGKMLTPNDVALLLHRMGFVQDSAGTFNIAIFYKQLSQTYKIIVKVYNGRPKTLIPCALVDTFGHIPTIRIKSIRPTMGWEKRLHARINALELFFKQFPNCPHHNILMVPKGKNNEAEYICPVDVGSPKACNISMPLLKSDFVPIRQHLSLR